MSKDSEFLEFVLESEQEQEKVLSVANRYGVKAGDYTCAGLAVKPLTKRAFLVLSSIFTGELSV